MNLKDFKERLDAYYSRIDDPEQVFVGVKITVAGSVGGTPISLIKSLHKGFDWDNNKFIIYPETDLQKVDHNELEKMRKEMHELGWSLYEFGNLKRENKKLKARIKLLENGEK